MSEAVSPMESQTQRLMTPRQQAISAAIYDVFASAPDYQAVVTDLTPNQIEEVARLAAERAGNEYDQNEKTDLVTQLQKILAGAPVYETDFNLCDLGVRNLDYLRHQLDTNIISRRQTARLGSIGFNLDQYLAQGLKANLFPNFAVLLSNSYSTEVSTPCLQNLLFALGVLQPKENLRMLYDSVPHHTSGLTKEFTPSQIEDRGALTFYNLPTNFEGVLVNYAPNFKSVTAIFSTPEAIKKVLTPSLAP